METFYGVCVLEGKEVLFSVFFGASRKVCKMGVINLLLFWNVWGQDDELSSLRITLEGGRIAQGHSLIARPLLYCSEK